MAVQIPCLYPSQEEGERARKGYRMDASYILKRFLRNGHLEPLLTSHGPDLVSCEGGRETLFILAHHVPA